MALGALCALTLLFSHSPALGLEGDRRPPPRGQSCFVKFEGWLVLQGRVVAVGSGRSYLVRADRGESGVGRIGGQRFRFDSACHVYRASGRWLPARPAGIWIRLGPAVAFATATGSHPRIGDRVSVTLSGARRASIPSARRATVRALNVHGHPRRR